MTFPGARPVTAPGWTGQPKTDLALIDCDVHHKVKKVEELFPYLPRVYREQILEQGFRSAASGYFNVTRTAVRTDLAEGCDAPMKPGYDGHAYGDDPEQVIRQHLDVWHVDRALLTGSTASGASVLPDSGYGAAICRAFNDWSIEHRLARDPRFILAINVVTSDPKRAVEEIERVGDHPQVRAIMPPTCALPPGASGWSPATRASAHLPTAG